MSVTCEKAFLPCTASMRGSIQHCLWRQQDVCNTGMQVVQVCATTVDPPNRGALCTASSHAQTSLPCCTQHAVHGCRLGRGSTPPGVADDYKSASLLTRAEEGDSTALHPQRTHSHARPIMRDAGSKSWAPRDRPGGATQAGVAESEYEGLV